MKKILKSDIKLKRILTNNKEEKKEKSLKQSRREQRK